MCGTAWVLWSQKNWKKIEKARDATEVRTIVLNAIKEQQVDVDKQYIWVWFGNNIVEDNWKCRFTYKPMANIAKTERRISIMVFIHWTAQEILDMKEDGVEKKLINNISLEILKKFDKNNTYLQRCKTPQI